MMRCAAIIAGCLMAGQAQAGCRALEAWGTGAAPFGFETCGTGLGEGGAAFRYCMKPFAYRDPAAAAEFARLNGEIAACLGQQVAAGADALVNHPDSYDLRRYETRTGTVSLSLKDKGALGQTLIFLRVQEGE